MTELQQRYFTWMVSVVSDQNTGNYLRLLNDLNSFIFYPKVFRDDNRIADSIDMRYRFGEELGVPAAVIASELDISHCSVLEVMVALAIRMEEAIMENDEIGDRTSVWFWGMVSSLGLSSQDSYHYNYTIVQSVIETFLERRYSPDGKGGLFTIPNINKDMRETEIWYQMQWYLSQCHRND